MEPPAIVRAERGRTRRPWFICMTPCWMKRRQCDGLDRSSSLDTLHRSIATWMMKARGIDPVSSRLGGVSLVAPSSGCSIQLGFTVCSGSEALGPRRRYALAQGHRRRVGGQEGGFALVGKKIGHPPRQSESIDLGALPSPGRLGYFEQLAASPGTASAGCAALSGFRLVDIVNAA